MNIKLLSKAVRFCTQHYDTETLKHVYRVATYVTENPLYDQLSNEMQETAYIIALLHDIIEDNFDSMSVREGVNELLCPIIYNGAKIACAALDRLTQQPKENYLNYIVRLRDGNDEQASYNVIAYIVKLADMKDHLMQKDTLTDKLKKKYWEALPYLL